VLGSALNAKFRMLLFRVDEQPKEYDVAVMILNGLSNLCQFIIITGGIKSKSNHCLLAQKVHTATG